MKDPAALLYIDKYLTATAEMSAECVGWYTKLILHQYDKGSLPNDIEALASLCNVRFSEFERFKQVFKQVLKQKFEQNDEGRLENSFAKEIISKRKSFKNKRSKSGIMGVFVKIAKNEFDADEDQIEFIKERLSEIDFENIEESKRKQMLKQMLKLYINVNVNKDIDKDKKGENKKFTKKDFRKTLLEAGANERHIEDWFKKRDKSKSPYTESALNLVLNECKRNNFPVAKAVQICAERGWKSFKYEWIKEKSYERASRSSKGFSPKNGGFQILADDLKRQIANGARPDDS